MPERKPCRGCGAPKPKQAGWNYCPDCRKVYAEKRRKDQRANSDGWAARNPDMRQAADRRRKLAAKPLCELCGFRPKVTDYEGGKYATRYCAECAEVKAEERREDARQRANAWYEAHKPAPTRVKRDAAYRREYSRQRAAKRRAEDPEGAHMAAMKDKARRNGATVLENVSPLVVLERDDGICGICDEEVDPFRYEIDHVIPVTRGGQHIYSNVQLAHRACNVRKSNHLPFEGGMTYSRC